MLASLNRSRSLRHTCLVKSKQYRDSSVKRTGTQSLCVQVTWSWAQSKRSRLWRTVSGMRTHALLECRPAVWRRFRIVWVDTLTPEAVRRSFRRVVAVQKGWRRAWSVTKWSCCVVDLWRPPPWRCAAVPNVWCRFQALLTTLWLTVSALATWRCEEPDSSIPMHLPNCSEVKRRRRRWGDIVTAKRNANCLGSSQFPTITNPHVWDEPWSVRESRKSEAARSSSVMKCTCTCVLCLIECHFDNILCIKSSNQNCMWFHKKRFYDPYQIVSSIYNNPVSDLWPTCMHRMVLQF